MLEVRGALRSRLEAHESLEVEGSLRLRHHICVRLEEHVVLGLRQLYYFLVGEAPCSLSGALFMVFIN